MTYDASCGATPCDIRAGRSRSASSPMSGTRPGPLPPRFLSPPAASSWRCNPIPQLPLGVTVSLRFDGGDDRLSGVLLLLLLFVLLLVLLLQRALLVGSQHDLKTSGHPASVGTRLDQGRTGGGAFGRSTRARAKMRPNRQRPEGKEEERKRRKQEPHARLIPQPWGWRWGRRTLSCHDS